jgi:hypothetical protein
VGRRNEAIRSGGFISAVDLRLAGFVGKTI